MKMFNYLALKQHTAITYKHTVTIYCHTKLPDTKLSDDSKDSTSEVCITKPELLKVGT